MQRVVGKALESIRPYFEEAAKVAAEASCLRAKCGTVIVKDGVVIGRGFNGPAAGDNEGRQCSTARDTTIKPKYDKTCCVHAEWRAILDACKRNPSKLDGATLYFMRIDEKGGFTDAGQPYCTVCSRLTVESGIGYFALWNDDGADVYDAVEYNQASFGYYVA